MRSYTPDQIITKLREGAQALIEMWGKHYHTIRPYSALGYLPPAPAALVLSPSQDQPVGLTLCVVEIMGAGHPGQIASICTKVTV